MNSAQTPDPTVILRLFHQSDPFRQIEERALGAAAVSIGRDDDVDWTIPDPERELSRRHCVIAVDQGQVVVRDTSANGVFVGPERTRAPAGEPVPVRPGETLRLGQYLIIVEAARPAPPESGFDAPFNGPLLRRVAVSEDALQPPSEWDAEPVVETGGARAALSSDGALLEAFCAGARLDPSAFSGEEPAEVMRRLGAVYQQMVLGLGDLMNERTSVKTEYRMTRTTVRSEGNNPFRWAPARRVAVDLLRARDDGFLSGPAAVKASFADMKKHLLCMLAGMREAVGVTLETLSPVAVEEELKGQSMVFKNRAGAAWSRYSLLHGELVQHAQEDAEGVINVAFRTAYERELQALDALSTRS